MNELLRRYEGEPERDFNTPESLNTETPDTIKRYRQEFFFNTRKTTIL